MSIHHLNEMTWIEVEALEKARTVAILPTGAIEAHGPHLPLDTDGIIAASMAAASEPFLGALGYEVLLLPAVVYSTAQFAADFLGTISIKPTTVTALITDIADNLASWRVPVLAIANAHLDPAHLASIHEAVDAIRQQGSIRVAFPDLTRRPWGSRLTDEFKSGACHAGQFESSIVLAANPDLVRDQIRQDLSANPASLSKAIAEGVQSFEEAGGPRAYFGDPAAATTEEGKETIHILGEILTEAVLQQLESEDTISDT